MDDDNIRYVRDDIRELRATMEYKLESLDDKLSSLEVRFVTKDTFNLLKNTVIGIITAALGYMGFDVNQH